MTRKVYALILATIVVALGVAWIAVVVTHPKTGPAPYPIHSAVLHSTPAPVRHI